MNYINQERLDKKLCIDCEYFVETLYRPRCGRFRSPVDDSADNFADLFRRFNCRGDYWKLNDKTKVVESKDEAARLRSEDFTDDFMDLARRIVKGETARPSAITCGGLEEAIRRAKLELNE